MEHCLPSLLSVCPPKYPSDKTCLYVFYRLSVCLSVRQCICLLVYQLVNQTVRQSLSHSVRQSQSHSVSLSVYRSACLSVCLSIYLCACRSVYLSVRLSVCLSVRLSVCLRSHSKDDHLTHSPSCSFVIMTTILEFCSMSIRQKSSTVSFKGPCVAMKAPL